MKVTQELLAKSKSVHSPAGNGQRAEQSQQSGGLAAGVRWGLRVFRRERGTDRARLQIYRFT